MELTVIIPTRDRRAVLLRTLDRLADQADAVELELVVVDDGSTDGTADAVDEWAAHASCELTLIRRHGSGPATARNAALAAARAPVCLFMDDDKWAHPGLLVRHRDFHRAHPEREAALLGRVGVAPDPAPSPFMRWLGDVHLGYADIEDPSDAGGSHFFSGNVSAKTEFLRSVGGFDESYPSAAHEDVDLGMRLEARGMRLAYDARAVADHYHPADLPESIDRMYGIGRSLAHFVERHPGRQVARRPGARHRVKAAALTALAAMEVRRPRVQHETWRFLCHEAAREGYWDAVDGRQAVTGGSGGQLQIGRLLARLASRDPDARMPPEHPASIAPHEFDLPVL